MLMTVTSLHVHTYTHTCNVMPDGCAGFRMKMMRDVFGSLSEGQQDQVKEWVREQIGLNDFNCSMADGSQKPDQGKPRTPGEMLDKHHVCVCV